MAHGNINVTLHFDEAWKNTTIEEAAGEKKVVWDWSLRNAGYCHLPAPPHSIGSQASNTCIQLTYHALKLYLDGGDPIKEVSMAKLFCGRMACDVVDRCLQVFGGYGFVDETPVSRYYRDAKALEIGEGTSEIQRLIIARGLGLPV